MKVTLQSQDPSTFSLEQTLLAPMLETSDGRNTQSIRYGKFDQERGLTVVQVCSEYIRINKR